MLENRLSARRIFAPAVRKSICGDRLGLTLSQRLISHLNLDHKVYLCYFMLSKWHGQGDEPVTVCPQTIKDWGFVRSEFYQTLAELGKRRSELCGESLIDFWHDPETDGWKVNVRNISKIMDKMAKELENG